MAAVSVRTFLSVLVHALFVTKAYSAAASSTDPSPIALLDRIRGGRIPRSFDEICSRVPREMEGAYRKLVPEAHKTLRDGCGLARIEFQRISVGTKVAEVESGPGVDAVKASMGVDGHEVAVYYYYHGDTLMMYCKDSVVPTNEEMLSEIIGETEILFSHPAIHEALWFIRISGPLGLSLIVALLGNTGEQHLRTWKAFMGSRSSRTLRLPSGPYLPDMVFTVSRLDIDSKGSRIYNGITLRAPSGDLLLFLGINPVSNYLAVKLYSPSSSFEFAPWVSCLPEPNLITLLSLKYDNGVPCTFEQISCRVPPDMEEAYRRLVSNAYLTLKGEQDVARIEFSRISAEGKVVEVEHGSGGVDAVKVSMCIGGYSVAAYYYYDPLSELLTVCYQDSIFCSDEELSDTDRELKTIYHYPAFHQAARYAMKFGEDRDRLMMLMAFQRFSRIAVRVPPLPQPVAATEAVRLTMPNHGLDCGPPTSYDGILISVLNGDPIAFFGVDKTSGDSIIKTNGLGGWKTFTAKSAN